MICLFFLKKNRFYKSCQKNVPQAQQIHSDIPLEEQNEKARSQREVAPKRRYVSVNLHGVMSRKIVTFTFTV